MYVIGWNGKFGFHLGAIRGAETFSTIEDAKYVIEREKELKR